MSDAWDSVSSSEAPSSSPASSWDSVSSTSGPNKFLHGQADKEHPNLWNVVYGLQGAYKEATSTGLLAQPVRMAMEASGYGMDKVKNLYGPGKSEQFYKDKLHEHYNQALGMTRDQAAEQVKDNPYPGHQVGNFMADVVGRPENLVLGGAGVGKSVAMRIGTAALANAGINSGSDAAAQGMDILTGMKKDFDVKQNLEQAAAGAIIGGGLHGVTEAAPAVSDFVKGLFKSRGVDTLPAHTPLGMTTPSTTGPVKFSPEEQAQFKQLLRTGSVDDIKSFFQGKNGQQPSFQDINKVVEFRNQMPENFVGQENFSKALDQHLDDQHLSVVNDHIATQVKDWKNAPQFEAINHANDIQDPVIRQQALADDPKGDALGFLGSDGKVRIYANRMAGPDMLNSVMYHEALGHYGLQQQFGDKLDGTIQTLLDRNVGSLKSETKAWQDKNPGAYGGDRIRAAEEVLANASNNGRIKSSWGDAITSNIRNFGRKMGLKLSYSDAEVSHILSMAHDAVINGKPSAAANGFRGAQPGKSPHSNWSKLGLEDSGEPVGVNKFMFTGPKALGFDENHPMAFTPSDGIRRNEISDRDAGLDNIPRVGQTKRLDEALYHPDFFENYPQLRDIKVEMGGIDEGAVGGYDTETRTIHLHPNDTNTRSTLLHEVQHAVQHEEGIIRDGETGNEKSTPEEYYADPREKEAYATEDRMDMSTLDRWREKPPVYMRRSDLAADADYKIQRVEEAYNSLERDYVPTVRSWDSVKQDALQAGFKPSQIKDFGDTPDLSKRLFRIQAAAKALDIRMSDTLKKLDTPDWSLRDQDNLRQMLVDHNYILNKLRDERAEAARALNMSKLGYTRAQMESFGELLKDSESTLSPLGDDATLLKFARQLKQLSAAGNGNAMNAMVTSLNKPNWEDYITTLHQNMMLSGLSTHVKAPLDMMIGIGRELMDSAGSLPFGVGREALRAVGINVKRGVHPTETAARLWGVLKAGLDAQTYVHTMQTLRNKGTSTAHVYGGKAQARIPIVSKVTDLISAQDAFFRAFATNMHLYGLGTRKALEDLRATGGKTDWDTVMTMGSNYAQQPSKELLKAAKDGADQLLLLNKSAITAPLDNFKRTTSDSSGIHRAAAFVTNFLTPFIRVEANSLVNRVIRRSPLALFDPVTLKALKKGGPEADLAMTRIALGTASIAAYWAAAGEGKVTGQGPMNPLKKKELMASGWRPKSTYEDGQYNMGTTLPMSFNPFDHHNSTATTVAHLREMYEAGANKGQIATGLKMALYTTFKDLADMSWISTISEESGTLLSPDATLGDNMDKFIAGQAATMLPNAASQYARVKDQTQVDTATSGDFGQTFGDTLKSKVPGLRETLPTRQSVYGEPLQGGASFAGEHTWMPQDNHVTGGNHTEESKDPVHQELTRLSGLIDSTLVTPVQRTITVNGEKTKLSNEQFEEYQQLAGRAIVETVRQEMSTPTWQSMSDQEKILEIKDIEKDMKKAAKESLYGNES